MSYPISGEALELFMKSYRQVADITFHGTQESIKLNEKDIVQGGLSVNRYCVSGSKIEIGSVIASELTVVLDNTDGRFNDTVFEGAELFVRIGTKKWDAHRWENAVYHYIPLGYFTVDEVPRKLNSITLTALDRMVMFDKAVDNTKLYFPTTVGNLLQRICSICGVTLGVAVSKLANYNYVVNSRPEGDNLTYRQYLSWIAEITGTCAYIDYDGHLILKWYEKTDTVLTTKIRHDSDLQENSITISGVQVTDDDTVYLAGSDNYAISIESNGLIQHDYEEIAANLYNKIGGFTYTPFSASTLPMPHLYPLDVISFSDAEGKAYESIITNYTYTINSNTVIEGKGESATKNGYAALDPLTNREKVIVSKIKKYTDRQITDREHAILDMNETICNSIGLRRTVIKDDSGGETYYFHDRASLADSSVIYTFKSGGFAWTDSWNNGKPVWQYGITKQGNAIYNALSAYKIQAEYLDVGAVRIAWNNSSKYINLTDGALSIYNSSNQNSNNLLMQLNHTGAWYYHNGATIGKIGTNHWVGDESYRGLVFDLEHDADYMTWAYRDSEDANAAYQAYMIFHSGDRAKDKGYDGKGLYLGGGECNVYFRGITYFKNTTWCGNNLHINGDVKIENFSGNAGGFYSKTGKDIVLRTKDTVFKCSDGKVECGAPLDMRNWSILNQSDERYKKNIAPTQIKALPLITQIEMKSYDWIENGEHCDIGVIAQQLREIIPELVHEDKKTGNLSIKTDKFIPYLIKAIQELYGENTNREEDYNGER